MDYGMHNTVARLGLEGTHIDMCRVAVFQMPRGVHVMTQVDPRNPANLFLDPFMGADPFRHPSGALTVVLPMALKADDFANLAIGVPAPTEVHGIHTLPGCLELARRFLGENDLLTNLRVIRHDIRAPIMNDLELVAGDRTSIKSYRAGRSDKPALECRIGGRDNAEVSVLGYQMVDSKINRVLVGQLDHDVLGRITTHRRTGDPQTILRATPAIPWTEREELCRFPIKAINYALDLAQIVIQEHLSTSNEPEELRGRPLYITRTSDVEWREPKFLFNGDSHLEVTVNEMVRVPSGPDAQSPTDSWEIEMRLSGDNRESWLKATMMVVRPPDLLPPTRGTMKYNQASARS